jgi:hypothetical protein
MAEVDLLRLFDFKDLVNLLQTQPFEAGLLSYAYRILQARHSSVVTWCGCRRRRRTITAK